MLDMLREAPHFLGILATAVVCSAIIGSDRERKNRPAGLRTHIIVCISATLIMYIGIKMKNDYLITSPSIDPARLAAQILSGIGFLGAGTIIKGKDNVHGLTTAATLWSVACIGIAVGAGYFVEGIAGTLAVFIVLRVVSVFEKAFISKRRTYDLIVSFTGNLGTIKEITRILESNKYHVNSSEILHDKGKTESGEKLTTVHFTIRSFSSKLKDQSLPDELLERFSFVYEVEAS